MSAFPWSADRGGGELAASQLATGRRAASMVRAQTHALRIGQHPRDRALRRRQEALDRPFLRQLGLLEPPARDLLAGADDQVAEEVHILRRDLPAGRADIA